MSDAHDTADAASTATDTGDASSQLAVQMYTLREFCTDASGVASCFEKVRAMGYETVQPAAAAFNTMPAEELKTLLDDHGLKAISTHRSLEQLEDATAEIDYHGILGCNYTSIGGWGFDGKATKSGWADFAGRFNEIAKPYAGSDLRIGYHNHSHEFIPFGLGDAPETIDPEDNPITLLQEKLSDDVFFELDTYWVAYAGACPAAWIRRMANRVPCLHVKDIAIGGDKQHHMVEIGAGNLHWPGILEAAKAAGVKHYIVERDHGDVDAFESLKISYENLRSMGLS